MKEISPILQTYFDEIGATPLLTREEEIKLANRVRKGDAAARDQMIRANLRLVVKIAGDYVSCGLPMADLIAEGNTGLMKATERFDPSDEFGHRERLRQVVVGAHSETVDAVLNFAERREHDDA